MKKQHPVVSQRFNIIYREENGWFIATVPSIPGCHTQGKTLKQVEKRITEAIGVCLESFTAHRKHLTQKEQRVFLGSVIVSG